jgi:hypothetical protein
VFGALVDGLHDAGSVCIWDLRLSDQGGQQKTRIPAHGGSVR